MRILLGFFRKYWHIALLGALFMVGEVSMDLIQPQLMERIVDEGILGIGTATGQADPSLVASVGMRMILTVIIGGTVGVLSGVCSNISGQHYGNDLRKKCYRRIMHFSFEQTDRFSTGSLITRITNDVTQVQQLCMQMIRGLIRCLMFFFGGTFALLSMDLSFGVIVAISFPFILLDVIVIVWKTNPLFTLLQKRLDKLNSIMQEDVGGIRVVKAFVQEDSEEKRFGEANSDLVNTQFRVEMLLSFLRPVMNIVMNIAVVGIIRIGAVQVRDFGLAPGTVMAAITYISQILNGMMMLAMIFQTLSRGLVSAGRLQEILDTEPAIASGPVTRTEGGDIVLDHVTFSYPGTGRPVLEDICLHIRSGETLAVIGATGSGKSTLALLLPRFYDVTEGSITIGGVNVRDYDLTALRNTVSICLQKSELFSTTILQNIDPSGQASEEDVQKAARAAQAEEFILQQPEGYNTPVAERGMSLSGGQRQRISIARCLLRHSPIVIFDDSTSALDLATEAKLYQALRSEYAGVTKIFIAQRIASVKDADRIVVLDQGRISGCATHDQLLRDNEIYRSICESQLKGGSVNE